MPVYVTRAHVTLGDVIRKPKSTVQLNRQPLRLADIFATPFCLRTLLITTVGALVVAGGSVMTIIGYKPDLLLPWCKPSNESNVINETDEQAVSSEERSIPKLLGATGPLRILIYTGPILMGVGFFSIMMSIVLFCEIKDRYVNNIVPKQKDIKSMKKARLYELVIEEFRKNYFRGIEVPLSKSARRKSKHRFSLALTGSGSLLSFGRRHSHDAQKRKRKSSRDFQNEGVQCQGTKMKRKTLKRILDPETWMKTSSLPNIRHKLDSVELRDIYRDKHGNELKPKRTYRSCEPQLEMFRSHSERTGVDNPAYHHSPPNRKQARPKMTKHESFETGGRNTHVTTVIIHRESQDNDIIHTRKARSGQIQPQRHVSDVIYDQAPCEIDSVSNEVIIDIDRDAHFIPKSNEELNSIPNLSDTLNTTHVHRNEIPKTEVCACGTDAFCSVHALGMDSGGSSLSLSWDNVRCEWNDARRNTEPITGFQSLCRDKLEPENKPCTEALTNHIPAKSKSTTCKIVKNNCQHLEVHVRNEIKRDPFTACTRIFKSDSNLPEIGTYSLLRQYQDDSLSLDSVELTDEMLNKTDCIEMEYI